LRTTLKAKALECVTKYTELYDGIVTVLRSDHPQLQFTGLVLAFPGCADAEEWIRYFLTPSNHKSPVKEHFEDYLSEISYHWYAENTYDIVVNCTTSWHCIGANPADVFMQSAQFLTSAGRIQAIVNELAPTLRVFCNEIGTVRVFTLDSAVLGLGLSGCDCCTVRVFRLKFTLEDATGSHGMFA
jgi:hypothetical protein